MADAKKPSDVRGMRKAAVVEATATESRIIDDAPPVTETVGAKPASDELNSESIKPSDVEPKIAAQPAQETKQDASQRTPPTTPARKPGMMPMLLSALIGGGIVLAGSEILRSQMPAAPSADVTALKAQIAALQARPLPQTPDLTPLTRKIDAVEQALGKATAAPQLDVGMADRLSGVETALTELRAQRSATAPSLEPLANRMSMLEQRLTQRGAEVDPRFKTITDDVAAVKRSTGLAAVAPAFGAVQAVASAFHQGLPFQTELEGAEALVPQGVDLTVLRGLAAQGAPTLQRLATEFRPLSDQIARETDTGSANAVMGFMERFIKVRPVGKPGGASVFDLLATMEGQVQRGALNEALPTAARLPEPARQTLAPWLQKADQRQKAAMALTTAQQTILAALKAQRP